MKSEDFLNPFKSNPDPRSQAMYHLISAGLDETLNKGKRACKEADISTKHFLEAIFVAISSDIVACVDVPKEEQVEFSEAMAFIFGRTLLECFHNFNRIRSAS